jgi:hypothetical protein
MVFFVGLKLDFAGSPLKYDGIIKKNQKSKKKG